jgi:2-oxoglutarate ferredoxin oxidoreductase subunit gamma
MMGYVLALAGMKEDRHVTFLPAYGAEVRGGTANCTVAVSDEEIASPIASSPEYVVAMNYPSMVKYMNTVKPGGAMFLNQDLISEQPPRNDITLYQIPANSLAHQMGNDRVLNMVMLGSVAHLTSIVSMESLELAIADVLEGKKAALVDINQKALTKGAEYAAAARRAEER